MQQPLLRRIRRLRDEIDAIEKLVVQNGHMGRGVVKVRAVTGVRRRSQACTSCGKAGHNSRTCPTAAAARPRRGARAAARA